MKKKINLKKLGAIGAGAVLALSLAFGMAFTDFSKETVNNNEANAGYTQTVDEGSNQKEVSTYATSITYPSGSTFGQFPNGFTYVYTDKSVITNFRAGKVEYDFKTQAVKTTGTTHGSLENPYVIANTTDWENLAKYVGVAANNSGAGKVFVLANDLDFSKVTTPRFIPYFKGSLFGLGHKLSNFTVKAWQYWSGTKVESGSWADVGTTKKTNAGFGMIGCAESATITDLILDKFNYTGMPSAVGIDPAETWGDYMGGIVGVAKDATSILNCQVEGTVTAGTFQNYAWSGGIVGIQWGTNGLIYRCSADTVWSVSCNYTSPAYFHTHHGGIIGDVYTNGSLSLFDCASNTQVTLKGSSPPVGGTIGFLRGNTTITVENTISLIVYQSLTTVSKTAMGGWCGPASAKGGSAKNIFANVSFGASGLTSVPFKIRLTEVTLTNVTVGPGITDSNGTVKTTQNAVIDAAKGVIGKIGTSGVLFSDKIWDKTKLTTAGMGTFTPDKSPVRNPLVTVINFKDTDESEISLANGVANPNLYNAADADITALPTPQNVPAGKEFVGWSLSKTSDSSVYNIFPSALYGSINMYPVWKMTGATVNSSATVETINGSVADRTITAKYIGEPVVTLTASATPPCTLSDCTVTWSWYKKEGDADEVKLDGETSNVLELTELTNATYYAKAKISHKNQLWRTEEDVKSNEFDVTIEKGVLSPSGGITLAETTGAAGQEKPVFAYWGQKLEELTALVVAPMQNTAGIAVAGTISWDDLLTKVADTQKTYPAYFHPTDTEHYVDGTPVEVTILPTILQWKFEFTINPQLDNVVYTFNEEYGKTYTRAQVADRFEETYFDWLNDLGETDTKYTEMVGRMPYFGSEDISQYRGTSAIGAYFDAEHVADNGYIIKDKESNSAVLTTPVAFNALNKSTMYTVTLYRAVDANNKPLVTITQTLGYGSTVSKPEATLYINGGTTNYLAGWFVSNTAGDVPAEDRVGWDFATDRITGHTFLGAEWEVGYLVLTDIWAKVNGSNRTFTARTAAKTTDFVVFGIYTVYEDEAAVDKGEPRLDSNGNPQTVELTLSSEDYSVSAEGVKDYHIKSVQDDGTPYETGKNYSVTIASKENVNLETTVQITVTAKRLDLSGINFPNQTVTYDENLTQRVGDASQEVAVALASQGATDNDYTISYQYYDSSNKLINTNEGVKSIGLYYVYLQLNFNTADFVAGRISATFTINPQPITVYVAWDADNQKEYTYNGQIQHPEATFYTLNEDGSRTPVTVTFVYTGNSEQKIANADGVYSKIGVELRNARYQLAKDAMTSIEFRINRAKVALPQLANNSFEFKNAEYDISEYIGYDSNTLEYLVEVQKGTAKDVPSAGTITSQVVLRDPVNSEWADGTKSAKQIIWTITAKVMTVPTFTETLVYSGIKYSIVDYLNFYDPVITAFGSEIEATNAGMYRANLRLPTENGGKNYVWASKDFNGTIEWQIQKAELYLDWDGWSYLFNGNTYSPRAKIAFGLVDADAALQNQDPRFVYTGDADKRESGSYKIDVSIGQTSELYKNYVIAKDSATFYWVIKESPNEVVITVVWEMPADGGYTFNGEVQYPRVKALYSENGMGEEDLDKYEITYTGDWNKSKWKGTYTVGVEITAEDNTPLRIRQGEATYVIRRAPDGSGEDPDLNKPTGPDDKTDIDNPTVNTVKYPVVQLIIGGVGAVLLVIFTLKTFTYASSTNEAKKKTKELAQLSYSFAAPVALLAVGEFLGLGDGAWWGISVGIFALAILMGAVMFVFRGKNKKALAALAEEQARVDDEKEAAKEMQRQRRDDEFKMMFAAMQQNYQQPAVNYDEMQNMISSAVTALLPTMQQQLQALPPAQSETDDLRSLMEQQQEMLNQLMQERQVQQDYQPQYNAAQGGEDYAELKRIIAEQEEMLNKYKFQEDTSLGTLEELYGKMSDEAKRCYYEIGGYIMSKPDTAQNDGKYAVLFKYRGITLFKLFIKNNAPVLAYTLDNEAQAELIIEDETVLEDAKQIVNMRIRKVDRDMNK